MADTPPDGKNPELPTASRRDVIKGVAGIAGTAAISAALPKSFAEAATAALPDPLKSGIDHIVVLMMENRSFDHMLGWVPGADGVQAGRTFRDINNVAHQSAALTKFQNCASADPDHSYSGGRTHFNNGAMDGFLKTVRKAGDTFPIGYFGAKDLAFFSSAARHWTICDRYFTGILGPTFPNRFYMHSGQTDRLFNASFISTLPTIWDRAAAKGVSARYYAGGGAFTGLWGTKFNNITFPFSQFAADVAADNLASITYIDPNFVGEGAGTSNDDHPLADVRNGQVLMNTVYQALTAGPRWASTLFVINYDEWGGFADHVVPPLAPVADVIDPRGFDSAGNKSNDGRLGIRVPCAIIGPRARRGAVVSTQFDPNSILNMICWRFGLDTLGVRGTSSINMATALDFVSPLNLTAPPVSLVNQVYGSSCSANPQANLEELHDLYGEHFAELEELQELTRNMMA